MVGIELTMSRAVKGWRDRFMQIEIEKWPTSLLAVELTWHQTLGTDRSSRQSSSIV
jgi:hypothetical protein